jgi:hypothetical protein
MHEAAIARAAAGEIRGDEFKDACIFFKEAAGINIHGDGTFIGWVATNETVADLEVLHLWYSRNARLLYVNEAGRVIVRGKPRLTSC